MDKFVMILLMSALFLNIIVSIFLIKREDLEPVQKIFQIIFIWLIPFIGAIGLFFFYSTQDKKVEPYKGEFGGGSGGGVGGSSDGG